ncbi:unnamed protein product [Rotaria sp. Silwood1]|nr:unnamed protein product [Rotaria sp. Silwood1]
MQFVKVFDNQQKIITRLVLDSNHKISHDYFKRTFPDAVGLAERDEYGSISIPSDENKNFTWNWNENVVYDLIYSDSRSNRPFPSTSSSSSSTITLKDKIWAWIGLARVKHFLSACELESCKYCFSYFALLIPFVLSIQQFQRTLHLMLYFLGIIILWIGGASSSLYANLYEDVVKLVMPGSSDNQPSPRLLFDRALMLLLISITYILSITFCTSIFIKKMWIKIVTWFKTIEIEELTRYPLTPIQFNPHVTTTS